MGRLRTVVSRSGPPPSMGHVSRLVAGLWIMVSILSVKSILFSTSAAHGGLTSLVTSYLFFLIVQSLTFLTCQMENNDTHGGFKN